MPPWLKNGKNELSDHIYISRYTPRVYIHTEVSRIVAGRRRVVIGRGVVVSEGLSGGMGAPRQVGGGGRDVGCAGLGSWVVMRPGGGTGGARQMSSWPSNH
jgi:hypothetical protein